MAKKPKKEKVNETPEERMARLKKEAQEAEERSKLQMDATRASLQARKEREQQYSKLNSVKIHNQWRKIMRMAKVDELRVQIEVLSQSHEREVDRKDAIIQMLDRDLEDAESQFESAVQGNFQVIEQLLDLQYQRLKTIDEDFSAKMKALDEEFSGERAEVNAAHARHKKDMNDIIVAMQSQFTELEADLRQDYEAAREDIKNKNTEDLNVMKITLESTIDELEKKFEISHEAYLMQTSERMATFNALTKTDAQAARVIDMRMRKLQRLQDQLKHWRSKISSNSQEWEDRNASLLAEKKSMSRHYQSLKSAMDSFRDARGERLKQLSLQAQAAEQELNEVVTKTESLIKLAEMCRRLETEQEKILPFVPVSEAVKLPDGSSPADEIEAELARLRLEKGDADTAQLDTQATDAQAGNTAAPEDSDKPSGDSRLEKGPNDASGQVYEDGERLKDSTCDLTFPKLSTTDLPEDAEAPKLAASAQVLPESDAGGPACSLIPAVHSDGTTARGLHEDGSLVQDHEYFDKFFLRYNKVLLDTMAVDREKKRLEQENEDLRTILKQYLDGISVNSDVMNNPLNPLMVVNQRLQLILQERDKARAMALKQQAAASP